MVAKKTDKKLSTVFQFRKEWIFDPVPPWVVLNRDTIAKINQLKDQFTKQINETLKQAQR